MAADKSAMPGTSRPRGVSLAPVCGAAWSTLLEEGESDMRRYRYDWAWSVNRRA